jgi:hypothetical protein
MKTEERWGEERRILVWSRSRRVMEKEEVNEKKEK